MPKMTPHPEFDLFDLLPDPVQIVDRDGHIVFMSAKMREVFGDLTGRICHQALKQSGGECRNCPRRQPDRQQFRDEQVEITAVNGRNYLVNHSTLALDGQPHVVETYKDITGYKRLLQENAQVTAGVNVAREVQQRCITVEQNVPGFVVAYRYRPSHLIAGDFLNVRYWRGRYLAIAVADVAGHGIGAAAVTFLLKTVYDQLCRERLGLVDFMRKLQRRLHGFLPSGHFVTLALVLIDTTTMTGGIINAGHPPVLHFPAAGGPPRRFAAQLPPLGIAGAEEARQEAPFALAPGDRLLLYSDGIFQKFNRSAASFLDAAAQLAGLPPEQVAAALLPPDDTPLEDDITLLVLDVLPAAAGTSTATA